MALELAITGILNKVVLGLSPMQRLDAVSKYEGDAETKRRFVIALIIIVAAIIMLYFTVAFFKRITKKLFDKSANKLTELNTQPYPDDADLPKDGEVSTSQIPLKKKIYIKPEASPVSDYIEADLVENTPSGLTLQFNNPIEIIFGQLWLCRYYTGSFVAEFRSIVTKCSGLNVVLKHTNACMVNRRRFLRVAVNQPAFIAIFPFKKETPAALSARSFAENDYANELADFETPRFVPAMVTELGGPGLRVTTSLALKRGDRVLLMFKLDHDHSTQQVRNVIEHIAFVRHIIKDQDRLAYALELTGLHDDGINELITATNRASIRMHRSIGNAPESGDVQARELVSV